VNKKFFKILFIIAGIIFLLFLVVNFGINLWLKNNLDQFLKKNSDYIVTYKTLDVDLGSGNIRSTGITINSKNPQNQSVIGLQGTVESLSISRLGIYDAIFNKTIKTSDLTLNKPNLNIILAKKNTPKKAKKQNDIALENITITQGNIQIFKATKQKMLSVHDFNLVVENLEMTEESSSGKLPFTFDDYQINGKYFYFRTDNIYAFTAKYITTKEGQMSIKNLAVNPLLSYENFTRFYPKKRNLFNFKASEMELKDIKLKGNKITLAKVRFENPDLKMFTTNIKPAEKEKRFAYDVILEDVLFNHSKINIVRPNGSPLFSAGSLTMNLKQFLMNEETTKGNIPFQYSDFNINGQNINYTSDTKNVKVQTLSISPKLADLKNIVLKPTVSTSNKTLMDLTVQNVNLKMNDWSFLNNKLKLNIENVLINGLNGKIVGSQNAIKKKPAFDGIVFPLVVKNVSLKNSNLIYDKGKKPLEFKDLNANLQNLEMNETTVKERIPFKIGFYSLSTRDFQYKTQFYNLSASLLKINKNAVQISNFAMIPTVSRAQFIRMIPTEKDLYNLKVNQINMTGKWDFLSANQFLQATKVTFNNLNANIFRSKIPKDDLTEKPLYSKLLRSIKFPMFINDLDIKNSILVYEEDTKKSDGPGKLTFNNFNLNVKNLNSGKMKGKPTQVAIAIQCSFMNASPMNIKWGFDTLNLSDAFAISGNVGDLPASRINPFIEPYLKIRATGLISDLVFNFKGNYNELNGSLNMKNQDLKVSVLTKDGEKNKLLSAVANIFVKTDSGQYPESVLIENVERDKTKSFFNLLWRGIEQGLKRTLIGKNAPETEKAIKKTVVNTKTTLQENKKNLQETKVEIKDKVQKTKQKVKEKGIFKNIFKKKSDS
jgi:hypothetical protein